MPAMPQVTVDALPAIGFEGAVANLRPTDTITVIADSTNGAIKPGRVVTRNGAASDREGVLPNATGEITGGDVLGITLWVQGREPGGAAGEYADGDAIPVLRKGVVWMLCETACAFGGDVFVRFTAPGDLGAVRNDADAGKAVALPTGRFRKTLGAAGLVPVEINLP